MSAIPRTLHFVIAGLLALTLVSWGVTMLELGGASMIVAIVIASIKVALVGLFFMELVVHKGSVRLVAAIGPVFLAVMLLLMLADVAFR